MASFFIFILTIALIAISAFTVLVILMQRPTSNGGLGSALGGGAAEMAFGGDTTRVLNKWTIYGAVSFFVLSLALSMLYINKNSDRTAKATMPTITEAAK